MRPKICLVLLLRQLEIKLVLMPCAQMRVCLVPKFESRNRELQSLFRLSSENF